MSGLALNDKVYALQEAMRQMPQVELQTEHFFADGMYARLLKRPAGTLIVGKVHRRAHFYIIVTGTVQVAGEDGPITYKAGDVIVSKPGTKRAVYALEDSVCITVHRTRKKNLDRIERELVEDDDRALFDARNRLRYSKEHFRELTKTVIENEKPGFWSDWTEEERRLYSAGDWEAFSKSRGYSALQIEQYRAWRQMAKAGFKRGMNPFKDIADLASAAALENTARDKLGEIWKSSAMPDWIKEP